MGISAAQDWYWFVKDLGLHHSDESWKAHQHLVQKILPAMDAATIPYEFVYDPTLNTSNLVLPKDFVRADLHDLFKLAGYREKDIPEFNQQGSAEMKEALFAGAELSKKWH